MPTFWAGLRLRCHFGGKQTGMVSNRPVWVCLAHGETRTFPKLPVPCPPSLLLGGAWGRGFLWARALGPGSWRTCGGELVLGAGVILCFLGGPQGYRMCPSCLDYVEQTLLSPCGACRSLQTSDTTSNKIEGRGQGGKNPHVSWFPRGTVCPWVYSEASKCFPKWGGSSPTVPPS